MASIKLVFTLLNKINGLPESGFNVKVFSGETLVANSSATDKNGKTSIESEETVLENVYYVVEQTGRSLKQFLNTSDYKTLSINAGQHEIELKADIRRIKGKVQKTDDTVLPAGETIDGVEVFARVESPATGVVEIADSEVTVDKEGAFEILLAGSDFLDDGKAVAISLEASKEDSSTGVAVFLAETDPVINPGDVTYVYIPIGENLYKSESLYAALKKKLSLDIYSETDSEKVEISGAEYVTDIGIENMGNDYYLLGYQDGGESTKVFHAVLIKDTKTGDPEIVTIADKSMGSDLMDLLNIQNYEKGIYKVSETQAAVCYNCRSSVYVIYIDFDFSDPSDVAITIQDPVDLSVNYNYAIAKEGFIYFWENKTIEKRSLSTLTTAGTVYTISTTGLNSIEAFAVLSENIVAAADVLGACAVNLSTLSEGNPLSFSGTNEHQDVNMFSLDRTEKTVAVYCRDSSASSGYDVHVREVLCDETTLALTFKDDKTFNDTTISPVAESVNAVIETEMNYNDTACGQSFYKIGIQNVVMDGNYITVITKIYDHSNIYEPEKVFAANRVSALSMGGQFRAVCSENRLMQLLIHSSSSDSKTYVYSAEYVGRVDNISIDYVVSSFNVETGDLEAIQKAENIIHFNPGLNSDAVYVLTRNYPEMTDVDILTSMSRENIEDTLRAGINENIIDEPEGDVDDFITNFIDDLNSVGAVILDSDSNSVAKQVAALALPTLESHVDALKSYIGAGTYEAAFAIGDGQFGGLEPEQRTELKKAVDITRVVGNRVEVSTEVYNDVASTFNNIEDLGTIPFGSLETPEAGSWSAYVGNNYPGYDDTETDMSKLQDAKAKYIRTIESNIENYDRSQFLYNKFPEKDITSAIGGMNDYTSTGARGTFYQCTKDVTVKEFGNSFSLSESIDFTWAIYEAEQGSATYSKIFNKTTENVAPDGTKFYSSGEIEVQLKKDRKYLFVVGWDGERVFQYTPSASNPHPKTVGFGNSTAGFYITEFSGFDETLNNPSSIGNVYTQEIKFTDLISIALEDHLEPNDFDLYLGNLENWLEGLDEEAPEKTFFEEHPGTKTSVEKLQGLLSITNSATLAIGAYYAGIDPGEFVSMDRATAAEMIREIVEETSPGYFGSAESGEANALNIVSQRQFGGGSGLINSTRNIELLYSSSSGPTISTLLGSMDLYEVDHADSLLGPAAYLTDLLQFLKGNPAAYNWFKTRRPDIANLLLNKWNAEIPMPYIDIVNEVLEFAIDYIEGETQPILINPDEVHNNIESTDPESLKVKPNPLFVKDTVYDVTLKNNHYPLSFDLQLEKFFALLEHIKKNLPDMPGFSDYEENETAVKRYLRINDTDYDLMTGTTVDDNFLPPDITKTQIGAGSDGDSIHSVGETSVFYLKDLLTFADIDLDRFYELTESDLIDNVSIPAGQESLDAATVEGVTWGKFKQMRIYDFLITKSDFSADDLAIINLLHPTLTITQLFIKTAVLKQTMKKYGTTLEESVILRYGTDLNKDQDYYEELFNNATIEIKDTETLLAQKQLLVRALTLNEEEFDLVVEDDSVLATTGNLTLIIKEVLKARKLFCISIVDYFKITNAYDTIDSDKYAVLKELGFSPDEIVYFTSNTETDIVTNQEQFDLSCDLGISLYNIMVKEKFPLTLMLEQYNNIAGSNAKEDILNFMGTTTTDFNDLENNDAREDFLKKHPITFDNLHTIGSAGEEALVFEVLNFDDNEKMRQDMVDVIATSFSVDSPVLSVVIESSVQNHELVDIIRPLLIFSADDFETELKKTTSVEDCVQKYRDYLITIRKAAMFAVKLSFIDSMSHRYITKGFKYGLDTTTEISYISNDQFGYAISLAYFSRKHLESVESLWEKWPDRDIVNEANALAALSVATGWESAEITVVTSATPLFDAKYWPMIDNFLTIGSFIDFKRETGLSYDNVMNIFDGTIDYESIESEILSKFDGKAQFEVQADINNIIREKKRDALVSYLLTRSFNVSVSDAITFNVRFEDVKALYSFYLLDPEMNACTMTSRTVLAISAVQLYIHRLLMGIETYPKLEGSEVVWIPFEHSSYTGREDIDGKTEQTDVSDFAREWEWRKNYRVWEANRKVFLYPENWIEPELRLDKTDFFKEFETELAQNALTDDHIEKTIASFVSKLKNVSDLKIIGTTMYNGERFVFGRTKNKPYKYYWTKRDSYMRWEGWHTLNVNPKNGHFVPVVRANKLHLIWPLFEEKSFNPDTGIPGHSSVDTSLVYYEISVNAVSYSNGIWSEERNLNGSFSNLQIVLDLWMKKLKELHWNTVKYGIGKAEVSSEYVIEKNGVLFMHEELETRTFEADIKAASNYIKDIIQNFNACYLQMKPDKTESINCAFDLQMFYNKTTPDHIFEESIVKYLNIVHGEINFSKDKISFYSHYTSGNNVPVNEQYQYYSKDMLDINTNGDLYSMLYSADDNSVILEDDENTVLFELLPLGSKTETVKNNTLNESVEIPPKYAATLTSFDHKTIDSISQALYKGGVKDVYSIVESTVKFSSYSLPPLSKVSNLINENNPYQTVISGTDYRLNSVFGLYNWELYFYIPMLVSKKLVQDQQFEKAQRWMHYIFDPMRGNVKGEKKYWRFKPFDAFDAFEKNPLPWKTSEHLTLYDILKLINDEKNGTPADFGDDAPLAHAYLVNTVRMWEDNPFEPHLLGQLLIKPYMRNVVITYINNLLAWGDMLFRQDTIESINEATQIYTVASDLLDRKPILFHQKDRADKTYTELEAIGLDELSNASTSSIVSNWSKDALQADKRIITNN